MDFCINIIRHPRENRSKCSLRILAGRSGVNFMVARDGFSFDATDNLLLGFSGEEICPKHFGYPLLILDSTWQLLPKVRGKVAGRPMEVSLPKRLRTAYPRVSKLYGNPAGGLASIEALYAALRLMGRRDESILKGYPYAEEFLRLNFP